MLKEIIHARFPTMEIVGEPGSELFTKLDTFHPNIVFIDIRLPGENKLELAQKIKMNYPDITVVILTSYDPPGIPAGGSPEQSGSFYHEGFPNSKLSCIG